MYTKDKIIVGYDIIFPYCEVPNGLNPKYLEFATYCDYNFDKSAEFFKTHFKTEWPVFNSRFLVQLNDEGGNPGYFGMQKNLVYNIIKDRERGNNYKWFYLLSPYGDMENFLGMKPENTESFNNFIPQKTLEEIRDYNGILLIDYAIDGGLTKKRLKKLYECISALNLPKEKIIIVHNDFHLEENMKEFFKENMPKLIQYCWSLNSKSEEYYKKISGNNYHFWKDERKTNYDFMSDKESIDFSKKEYKFLNLNRRLRMHRADLLHFFWKENMINDMLISYDEKLFTLDAICHLQKYIKPEEFNDFYHYIKHTSPHVIDYSDLENVWGYGFETKEIYQKSLISILSETFFYENSGYLSEKIWKPIAHGHPFILVGPHHSLKFIKEEFGFKTFSPYINEEYDNEPDHFKRIELIKKEISRLNNMEFEDLKNLVKNLSSIILFNKKIIRNYGSKAYPLDYFYFLKINEKNDEANKIFKKLLNNKNVIL